MDRARAIVAYRQALAAEHAADVELQAALTRRDAARSATRRAGRAVTATQRRDK